MDSKEEYHDPDYPEVLVVVKEEPQEISEEEKVGKIKHIVNREFSNELEIRENEVMFIEQRLTSSRRLLHRLRYAIVSAYYNEHKLKMTRGQIEDEIAAQRDPRSQAEIASLLRDGQRRIHPSVRKLLGKKTVDIDEIFKTRAPRNKVRKDYSKMLQKRNYTIQADSTKTLRPDTKSDITLPEEPCGSKPKKVPRHLDPKISNVVTLDEATRNKMKHRYRIIIGNTSKYAPAASSADRSTHKWLLYIRGPPHAPDLKPIVTAVTVTLHHSYAPHHTVHLDKPPYHISRRGWGEFPAKVELHFALPDRNRPAAVTHDIKLDRNYTGMQMLGAETIVDVWLYSTIEMTQYEFKEEDDTIQNTTDNIPTETFLNEEIQLKDEPLEENVENTTEDSWLDFFNKETELDVDEMIIKPPKVKEENEILEEVEETLPEVTESEMEIRKDVEWTTNAKSLENNDIPSEILSQPPSVKKRIVKYIDPITGKIYYLEMDRTLDLSKVQEIVINNKPTKISPIRSNGLKNVRKKKGMSLLKPEVKSLLKNDTKSDKIRHSLAHIENDHCYLASPSKNMLPDGSVSVASEVKREKTLYNCLCSVVYRLDSVRSAVNYLVKKIPLISDQARDPDFVKNFPFVVENCDRFWKLDFSKRRNIEWSRAKLINRILTEHFINPDKIWRTKQILLYTRLYGFYPTRSETYVKTDNDDWSSWHNKRKVETNIKEYYPNPSDICTLSTFDSSDSTLTDAVNLIDSDVEVDVVCDEVRRVKKEVDSSCECLTVLPVENEENRLRFMFLERKCADIGIELRNEDVGSGYSYSAVHAVMLSAVKSFAEELIRSGLAAKLSQDSSELPLPTIWAGSSSSRTVINLEHLYAGMSNPRLHALTSKDIGTERKNTYAI